MKRMQDAARELADDFGGLENLKTRLTDEARAEIMELLKSSALVYDEIARRGIDPAKE